MNIDSVHALEQQLRSAEKVLVHFWAAWCEPCKHMDLVITELAKLHKAVTFVRVEAEEVSDISEKYEIAAVPCFLAFKGAAVAERLEGADAAALTAAVEKLSGTKPAAATGAAKPFQGHRGQAPAGEQYDVTAEIKRLLNSHRVMLFMKGSPAAAQCGFSSKVVTALQAAGCTEFGTFDILTDASIRQGLKEYSDWPTYPQLYVDGELVGGCDIVLELAVSGELRQVLGAAAAPAPAAAPAAPVGAAAAGGAPAGTSGAADLCAINKRCEQLVKSAPVMLFMKGTPDEPKCGFSRRVVEALQEAGCSSFGSFDILSDQQVRDGLKQYSNWPTFPQLYVKGELVGGCDIILEMKQNGELKELLDSAKSSEDTLTQRLKALVNTKPVMLFMKGTPDEPRCGFSRQTVEALQAASQQFGSFDILSDEEVRQGLKKLSDWPTYPQLYAGGELVGGCDIIKELAAAGELKETLDEMTSRMDKV